MSALSLILALAQPGNADFLAAEWGSTPEQVELSTDGIARVTRSELPPTGISERVGSKGKWKKEGLVLKLRYFYDSTGLVRVHAETKYRDCQNALSEMQSRFGEPLKVNDQIILTTIIWEDEASDSRIAALVSSAGICSFNLHRLSTFEPDKSE